MHKSVFLLSASPEVLSKAKELNLDSVFIHSNLVSEHADTIKKELGDSVKVYADVLCFNSQELAERFPDAKVVDAAGLIVPETALCPSHPGVREAIFDNVSQVLKHDIDGIWLYHARYPTNWEDPDPTILDVCYCDRCLDLFEEYLGDSLDRSNMEELALLIDGAYYHEWLEFKAEKITSLFREVRKLIDSSKKDVKLGLFLVPWEDKEYGAGIQRVVAQDMSKLMEYLDIFSPMLYHRAVGQDTEWIKGKIEYFWQIGMPFFPFIQSENTNKEINIEEFKKILEYSVESPSQGVCVFTLDNLINNKDKFKVLQEFYSK